MRMMERNKSKFFYALYKEKVPSQELEQRIGCDKQGDCQWVEKLSHSDCQRVKSTEL